MRPLGKNQKSALATLLKLVLEKGEECIPTVEITRRSRLPVNVGTMKSLEKRGLVAQCEKTWQGIAFLRDGSGGLDKIHDYSEIPNLEERGEEIIWVSNPLYSWKLTKEGRKIAQKESKE